MRVRRFMLWKDRVPPLRKIVLDPRKKSELDLGLSPSALRTVRLMSQSICADSISFRFLRTPSFKEGLRSSQATSRLMLLICSRATVKA